MPTPRLLVTPVPVAVLTRRIDIRVFAPIAPIELVGVKVTRFSTDQLYMAMKVPCIVLVRNEVR